MVRKTVYIVIVEFWSSRADAREFEDYDSAYTYAEFASHAFKNFRDYQIREVRI